MPGKIEQFPLYVVNEPVTYKEFTGGINTDASNEHLQENEMRDAVNMHFSSGALVKRKGATKLAEIVSPEPLHNIQGVSLFTYRLTYLVIAANGKLYSGIYNPKAKVFLSRLHIIVPKSTRGLSIDPQDMTAGLETYEEELSNVQHNGYIMNSMFGVHEQQELIFQNYRKIEGSTYNNKLYMATGTRIIEIELITNKLQARTIEPKLINNNEFINIGINNMSPYPELARRTVYNQAITAIDVVLVTKTIGGLYRLEPMMVFHGNEAEHEYFFKWEKYVNNEWVTLRSYRDNLREVDGTTKKINYYSIEVDDAHIVKYRCSFTKEFEKTSEAESETREKKEVPIRKIYPQSGNIEETVDWVEDKITGNYFGQAISIPFNEAMEVDSLFKKIQSCTKIVADGNKFLLYGDNFNSGAWFKTVIDQPEYTTLRGSLSFKTDKNEELIKVVLFSNNIIAFANSPNTGGSIHLITGNGDDFQDEYYSPYRRRVINGSISCNNPNTVQVAENLLFFKYFKTVYYIRAGELNNEVVRVLSANDKIISKSRDVEIPWDDNECISEITQDYYAIIWKEKFHLEDGDLIQDHPAMKVKLYYKYENLLDGKIYYPWLRDESKYFNIDHIIYLKGNPIYLYNNVLVSWDKKVYTDFDDTYKCLIRFRAEDLGYPKMMKFIHNILVYYHRNQYSSLNFEILVKNEAGHTLLDSTNRKPSIQDFRSLRTGGRMREETLRLDSTILDTKVFNTSYRFPMLLADTTLTAENDKEFSVSSITFNYDVIDIPETNPYDLYATILRKKEV